MLNIVIWARGVLWLGMCPLGVLWSLLSGLAYVFICREEVDVQIFPPPWLSGEFSMKYLYGELEGLSGAKSASLLVWLGLPPPRVEALCWLAISGKVLAVDNLRRRGLSLEAISDLCSLCDGFG